VRIEAKGSNEIIAGVSRHHLAKGDGMGTRFVERTRQRQAISGDAENVRMGVRASHNECRERGPQNANHATRPKSLIKHRSCAVACPVGHNTG